MLDLVETLLTGFQALRLILAEEKTALIGPRHEKIGFLHM